MKLQSFLILTLLVAGASSGFAQDSSVAEIANRIDAYAAPFAEVGHLSGTVLVARGSDVIYERCWGLADRELNIPFRPQTPSCIASLTKPTTVIIASQLIDSGHISLDDPITKWLEDFPSGDQIQVRHLLFHRSGIPHRLAAADDETVPRTPANMVDLASRAKLEFEPGSKRSYSSGGFSVLVRVLEVASGKTYEQLFHETILKPLELADTFHPGTQVDLDDAAKSYRWTIDGQQLAPSKHYSFLVGAGSLFSTPRDLLAISRALVEGQFGPRAKKNLLRFGKLRWNGITNHYRAYLEYDAKTDVTVAMVSNQMVGANDLLRQSIPKIVAGEHVKTPAVPNPEIVELPSELLESYAARYDISGPMPVRARDGALFADDWILLPTSKTTFFSPQDYGTVKVVLENGTATALDWGNQEYARLGPLEK